QGGHGMHPFNRPTTNSSVKQVHSPPFSLLHCAHLLPWCFFLQETPERAGLYILLQSTGKPGLCPSCQDGLLYCKQQQKKRRRGRMRMVESVWFRVCS